VVLPHKLITQYPLKATFSTIRTISGRYF